MDHHRNWVWVLVLGGLLLFPRLGSFGLWDPAEIQHADVAREMLQDGSLLDVTVGGKYAPRAVLPVWLVAAGFKLFGINELAARLPIALLGLFGLWVAYRVGTRLVDGRAGLAAAFVLATLPGYLFQSRQLGGDVASYVGLLAATGGLLSWIIPADGRRRRGDLLLGAAGLVIGALSAGILLGWVFPLLALGVALLTVGQVVPGGSGAEERGTVTVADGVSAANPVRAAWQASWPGLWRMSLVTAGIVGLALLVVRSPVGLSKVAEDGTSALVWSRQGVWLVLGGMLRPIEPPPSFDLPLRRLAYHAFPWFALFPLALSGFVLGVRNSKVLVAERLVGALVVVVFTLGYLANFACAMWLGPRHFFALPLIALGLGVWLWRQSEVWRRAEPISPFGALVAAGLLFAIQQDFALEPATLALSHVLDDVAFPVKLDIRSWVRLFGVALPLCAFIALAAFGTRPGAWVGGGRWYGRALGWVPTLMTHLTRWARPAMLVLALGFAAWAVHWLTPQLSLHMSNKSLYETYQQCLGDAKGAGLLGQYRTSGRGAAYYTGGQVEEIHSQAELFTRLRAPQRFYAVVPADQLGAIDQMARRERVNYYVLDARSSKSLEVDPVFQTSS